MLNSLNISLYKNGYSVNNISCLDIPIAGAAGYFDLDNYFYYCFYVSYFRNWTSVAMDDWSTRAPILQQLGLTISPLPVRSTAHFLRLVRENLEQRLPLLMYVKYRSLFYYPDYQDQTNNSDHAILISGYDPERALMVIRECSITRKLTQPENRGDALFPLQLRNRMVIEIWQNSRRIYRKEKPGFVTNLYVIRPNGSQTVRTDYLSVVKDCLSYGRHNNQLSRFIADFGEWLVTVRNINRSFELVRRNFYGPLTIAFDIFEKAFESVFLEDRRLRDRFFQVRAEYLQFRDALLAKLLIMALRKEPLGERQQQMIDNLYSQDEQLFSLIDQCVATATAITDRERTREYRFIDLTPFFNNQGFGNEQPAKTAASFSTKGSYLLPVGLPTGCWQLRELKFNFPEVAEGRLDNLYCDGQTLPVPEGYYRSLMILGCAELGVFSEALEIQYGDGSTDSLVIHCSDFGHHPVFSEEQIAWRGPWMQNRKGTKCKVNDAQLYAKKYPLGSEKTICAIKLPVCRNIHIFALTFGR